MVSDEGAGTTLGGGSLYWVALGVLGPAVELDGRL